MLQYHKTTTVLSNMHCLSTGVNSAVVNMTAESLLWKAWRATSKNFTIWTTIAKNWIKVLVDICRHTVGEDISKRHCSVEYAPYYLQ